MFKLSPDKIKNIAIGAFVLFTAAVNIYNYYSVNTIKEITVNQSNFAENASSLARGDSLGSVLSCDVFTDDQALNNETDSIAKSDDTADSETNTVQAFMDAGGPGEMQISVSDKDTGLIDINTATADELQALPGIGPTKAAAIIEYRRRYGGFICKEEIDQVKGIGPATYQKIEGLIYASE